MNASLVGLAAALAVAGCGGVNREEFVRQAGEACRATDRIEASAPPEDRMTSALDREVERHDAIEPPEQDAESDREFVRLKAATADAWRQFVDARAEQDHERADALLTRTRKTAVDAAQVAKDLGIQGCERALY